MVASGDKRIPPPRPRVVLITGASAGLGAAARELVCQKKTRLLALTARRGDRLDGLAGELRGQEPGLDLLTIAADLADPTTPERLTAETVGHFGGLDVLVNNAGLGLPTLFADAEPDHLARQLAVNFTAPLLLARHCMPSLIERRGMIINIGSAITCVASSALGAYGATKAGLAYWNDSLRRELHQKGVAVCLVEPGPFHTEFMDALGSLVPRGGRAASDSRQRSSLDVGRGGNGRSARGSAARSSAPQALDPKTASVPAPGHGRTRARLPPVGRPACRRAATSRPQRLARRRKVECRPFLTQAFHAGTDIGPLNCGPLRSSTSSSAPTASCAYETG